MITSEQISQNACGEIQWKDDAGVSHWALFAAHTDLWAIARNLPHAILFNNTGAVRYAEVKKTVVIVGIDEDAHGKAVTTKWNVKTKFYTK